MTNITPIHQCPLSGCLDQVLGTRQTAELPSDGTQTSRSTSLHSVLCHGKSVVLGVQSAVSIMKVFAHNC